eukprot:SRR837773.15640.p1 GENE.SRR837773.15640~~SRR837773.15640.p1  ORF type:complete len:105 (-),score=10.76 SRR837773.15640:53-367(-)
MLAASNVPGELQQEVLRNAELNNKTHCTCDVCSTPIAFKSFVWACEGRDETILHALSFDVCDVCFRRHALKDSEVEADVPALPHGALASANSSDGGEGGRCSIT